jgi:hypothetical protein
MVVVVVVVVVVCNGLTCLVASHFHGPLVDRLLITGLGPFRQGLRTGMLEASKAVLKNVAPDLPEMQVRISCARLQVRLF